MIISGAAPRTRHPARRRGVVFGYLTILPYVISLLLFGLIPAVYAVYMSFFFDPTTDLPVFKGLENYVTAFSDFRFGAAFINVFLYMVIWLPITVILVLVLALLLHAQAGRFTSGMRLIYYLPGAVSGSASAILWIFMFDPQVSPFAPVIRAMGHQNVAEVLYAPNVPVLLTIIAFSIGAGGWIVIMYGAFQNIHPEIIEAAKIDGSGPFQMAWRIKLPLIAKYVVYMVILSFAGGAQIFAEPQLLGKASGGKISPTWSPNQLAYEFAFQLGDLGASAVVSLVLLVIGLIGALLIVFGTNFFSSDMIKERA